MYPWDTDATTFKYTISSAICPIITGHNLRNSERVTINAPIDKGGALKPIFFVIKKQFTQLIVFIEWTWWMACFAGG